MYLFTIMSQLNKKLSLLFIYLYAQIRFKFQLSLLQKLMIQYKICFIRMKKILIKHLN